MFKRIISILLVLLMLNIPGVFAEIPADYDGTPFKHVTVPGKLYGRDFDNGGKGVAYYTTATSNTSTFKYRPDEFMTMFNGSGNLTQVMSLGNNMWACYTVDVLEDGTYDIIYHYGGSGTMNVYVDGVMRLEGVKIPSTGGTMVERTVVIGAVKLTKGKHVIKFENTTGGMSFESVTFYKQATSNPPTFKKEDGAYKKMIVPTSIHAMDFDLGESGWGTYSKKPEDNEYREAGCIRVDTTTTGEFYPSLRKDEWLSYTFEVEVPGEYMLKIYNKTSGTAEVYYDDEEEPSYTVSMPPDSASYAGTRYFEKGTHTMRIESIGTKLTLKEMLITDKIEPAPVVEEETIDEYAKPYKEFFVGVNGDDSNDGSIEAPFKTLERARDAAKEISDDMTGDIHINVLSGFHKLENTLNLDSTHSGKNGYDIVYRGYNALDTPIISGGEKITGWTKYSNGIWSAPVNNVDTYIRHFYVNGALATRASTKYAYMAEAEWDDPNTDFHDKGLVMNKTNFIDLTGDKRLELVMNALWCNIRMPIGEVRDLGDKYLLLQRGDMIPNRQIYTRLPQLNIGQGKMFYLENSLKLLDEPGEFFYDYDTKTMHYMPYPEEDMTTAETYVAKTEFMIKGLGESAENPISNIRIENLDFRHGAWYEVNDKGFLSWQADDKVDGKDSTGERISSSVPAQVQFDYADSIAVRNCKFSNLGSNAVGMYRQVTNAVIEGNVIHDTAASGISVGETDYRYITNNSPIEKLSRNIKIQNNVIHRIGLDIMGSVAIGVYYASYVDVLHNDIKDTPYTAITNGWGWEVERAEVCSNNIMYNRIENISYTVRDGGHIYNVGPMHHVDIAYNYCINSDDYGGVYFDSGTESINVYENVFERTKNWLFGSGRIKDGWNFVVKNNYADRAEEEQWTITGNDRNDYTQAQIVDLGNGTWPVEAQEIINNAGVEPSYKYLLKEAEYPSWRTFTSMDVPKEYYETTKIIKIRATDYMEGGEGVAFHKTGEYTEPKTFIQQENVVVGATNDGEWIKYKVNIGEETNFTVDLQYAYYDNSGDPRATILIDDKVVGENVALPNTGSWTAHMPLEMGKITLSPGEHIITVKFHNVGWSFEQVVLKADGYDITDEAYDEGVIKK